MGFFDKVKSGVRKTFKPTEEEKEARYQAKMDALDKKIAYAEKKKELSKKQAKLDKLKGGSTMSKLSKIGEAIGGSGKGGSQPAFLNPSHTNSLFSGDCIGSSNRKPRNPADLM